MKYIAENSAPYAATPAWAPKQNGVSEMDAAKQRAMFSKNPDSQYAVARTSAIHPSYELWVHGLLDGVRRQLQAIP